jgi:hypothetical protein
VGENFMDVSLYMRDAPLRQLPLLGGHISRHDWYNLFTDWNMLESAESVADAVFFAGILLCIGAIGSGIVLSVKAFLHPQIQATDSPIDTARQLRIEESLDALIEKKESRNSGFN